MPEREAGGPPGWPGHSSLQSAWTQKGQSRAGGDGLFTQQTFAEHVLGTGTLWVLGEWELGVDRKGDSVEEVIAAQKGSLVG